MAISGGKMGMKAIGLQLNGLGEDWYEYPICIEKIGHYLSLSLIWVVQVEKKGKKNEMLLTWKWNKKIVYLQKMVS